MLARCSDKKRRCVFVGPTLPLSSLLQHARRGDTPVRPGRKYAQRRTALALDGQKVRWWW